MGFDKRCRMVFLPSCIGSEIDVVCRGYFGALKFSRGLYVGLKLGFMFCKFFLFLELWQRSGG